MVYVTYIRHIYTSYMQVVKARIGLGSLLSEGKERSAKAQPLATFFSWLHLLGEHAHPRKSKTEADEEPLLLRVQVPRAAAAALKVQDPKLPKP